MKSKIHRATVTDANVDYEGSVTIDRNLMRAADLVEFERVEIYDITNGSRLATYAIPGEAGSGVICTNGAAAQLIKAGDMIILVSYAQYDATEIVTHIPTVVQVDAKNQVRVKTSA